MHSSCGLWALLLLLLTMGPATALKEDERQLMVQLHNLYRAQVSPPASDMLQMRWDPELAAFAKAYAQKCVWGHNEDRGRRGENLFAITDEGLDLPLAVEEWHHEREHYNLSAGACAAGQMCGHYTQVVWSKTERIGCGSHFCETLQGVEETNIHLLVCNYEPPGNVKGKRPYREGTPCSQCPPGYSCENTLCEPIRGPEEAQDLTPLVTEAPSTVADEASGPGKTDTPSLATETPSFSVPEVPGSLATAAPPMAGTKAPSSLATDQPASMATEAPPSLNSEVPFVSASPTPLFLEDGPGPLPRSTRVPILRAADEVASKTSAPPTRPESSQHPTGAPLPRALEEVEAEAELPPSSEVMASVLPAQGQAEGEAELPPPGEGLATVFPAQAKPGELQATLGHLGHAKSLPNVPGDSASGNAVGGRTLALQSSLPGAEGPEKPGGEPGRSVGHTWAPASGLLLLPPLLCAGLH
ncbi:PREDICTED: peptidase inhibitor 16 isoform X2 [Chinchilla lanigera]|uniref:Peptidase inhibitor 16 n=1 Tax=Chinchilla lanigera TaxID=34839 RepID=A0A8C2VZN5_CHILA|nr:PREDICTED: peptidase inhibitor 16 isoform X2 [Chinchilla lanigera]